MKKYVLCCVTERTIPENFLEEVYHLLHTIGGRIESLHDLHQEKLKAVDINVLISDFQDHENFKFKLMEISNRYQIDAAFMNRSEKRLIVFDMDSTLIQHEVIDEMALTYGIGDQIKKITERAMNGELNFNQSLTERVALLKGFPQEEMEKILNRLKLTPGAMALVTELKKRGFKTAIISGGFKYFAENIRTKLNIDYAFANDLEWEGSKLSGKVISPILNAEEKARLLEKIAHQEGFSLEETIAVGDGANDLPMLSKAGMGIAFHAKEKVKREAPHQLSFGPMTSILYFLGIPGNHFHEAL